MSEGETFKIEKYIRISIDKKKIKVVGVELGVVWRRLRANPFTNEKKNRIKKKGNRRQIPSPPSPQPPPLKKHPTLGGWGGVGGWEGVGLVVNPNRHGFIKGSGIYLAKI